MHTNRPVACDIDGKMKMRTEISVGLKDMGYLV